MIKIDRGKLDPEESQLLHIELLEYLYDLECARGRSNTILPIDDALGWNRLCTRTWTLEAWGGSYRITTSDKTHETFLALKFSGRFL